jgi:23S rRNA (adenine2503-C2)-methyltransferase
MLEGINDRYEQAIALADVLEPRHAFKVNLIPYNPIGPARASPRPPAKHPIGPARASPRPPAKRPTEFGFRGSGRHAIAAFRAALEERGLRTTVRLTRGRDIDAACGQLAARA